MHDLHGLLFPHSDNRNREKLLEEDPRKGQKFSKDMGYQCLAVTNIYV